MAWPASMMRLWPSLFFRSTLLFETNHEGENSLADIFIVFQLHFSSRHLKLLHLRRLAKSAPVNPGVIWAISLKNNIFCFSGLFRACTLRIASRPLISGKPTVIFMIEATWTQKVPGQISGLLVFAMMITSSLGLNPSISTKSWLRVSVLLFRVCATHTSPSMSTDSINFINKYNTWSMFFGMWKESLTWMHLHLRAISTKSEPLILKKWNIGFACHSLSEQKSILPVPGLPSSKIPLGILPQDEQNALDFLRN